MKIRLETATAALGTVLGVPIIETGIEFPTASGPLTIIETDLVSIVEAAQDPGVQAPRLKLGHDWPVAGDGTPSFGVATNLRLQNNDQIVVADFEGVPQWIIDVMPTAWPSRSIEGSWDHVSGTGRKYPLIVTAVALLGITLPGDTTIDDLPLWFGEERPPGVTFAWEEGDVVKAETIKAAVTDAAWNGAASRFTDEQYAASCVLDRADCGSVEDMTTKQRYSLPVKEPSGTINRNGVHAAASRIGSVTACDEAKKKAAKRLVSYYKNDLDEDPPENLTDLAASRAVQAQVDVDDVRRQYYVSIEADREKLWWWIRAIRLDPDELIVDDDEGGLYRVPFSVSGDTISFSEPVLVKVVYEDIAAAKIARSERVFASREASRPNPKGARMDPKKIRELLGLAEDASDDEVYKTLGNVKLAEPEGEPKPEGENKPEGEPTEGEGAPKPVAEPIAASKDLVTLDPKAYEDLQAGAVDGREARKQQQIERKAREIGDALTAGKFPPSRTEHWETSWDKDPEGTSKMLAELKPGLVPVGPEAGGIPADEIASEQAIHEKLMASFGARKGG